MDYETIVLDADERMQKACDVLRDKFHSMRTGRASPGLVEGVRVDYYGTPTPLKQLANISAPEADLILIKPFDPGALGEIEKSIMKSDVGIHPSNDGKVIRLQVPPLSQERRKQLAQRAKETAEESRVAVRNIRRDANKNADEIAKTMSEDDVKALKEEVQDLVKTYEKKIDQMLKEKADELTSF